MRPVFTGIIEDLGTVESLKPTDQGAVISVHTSLPVSEITIGDSITVNGACLTVTSKSPGSFAMDVSANASAVPRGTFPGAEAAGRLR